MKKYITLAVNSNIDYLYYTPLAIKLWNKFGWTPILFFQGNAEQLLGKEFDLISDFCDEYILRLVNNIDGYRSDTITQISRLYGSCVVDGYIISGDIDLIPLSDFIHPDVNKITVYNHDLTGFTDYPICYIGMDSLKWADVMNIKDSDYNKHIKRDLDGLPQAKSTDFYQYWGTDQNHITARLKQYGLSNVDFINRGQYPNGYAKGRVDRGSWSLDHEQFIDCHMHRDIFKAFQNKDHEHYNLYVKKWNETLEMLYKLWPDENLDWFINYTQEYAKLTQI
jgi:hypothetical protein